MAEDKSTSATRLQAAINWCKAQGWDVNATKGAMANASVESHAWMESDPVSGSKYFDFCVYGGASPYAGYDWYTVGLGIDPNIGAYGLFQWLSANNPAAKPEFDAFFIDGNSPQKIAAQMVWWTTKYGWMAGGDLSYTTTPNANSNISLEEYAKNVNKEDAEAMSNIWYVNFERAGAGQYPGHNWNGGIQQLIADWGIDWGGKGDVVTNPPDESVSPPKKPDSDAPEPCIMYENTGKDTDDGKKPAPPTGGGGTPTNPVFPNGQIKALDGVLGQTVGWGGAYGECYGFAQYWVQLCGGNGAGMNGGLATGNPNIGAPRPAGQAGPAIPASCIPWDFPWGTGAGFQGFEAYAGTPPGGWKTGDICCMTTEGSMFGHVVVVESVQGDDFLFADQNWGGARFVQRHDTSMKTLLAPGQSNIVELTGCVRPKQMPKN